MKKLLLSALLTLGAIGLLSAQENADTLYYKSTAELAQGETLALELIEEDSLADFYRVVSYPKKRRAKAETNPDRIAIAELSNVSTFVKLDTLCAVNTDSLHYSIYKEGKEIESGTYSEGVLNGMTTKLLSDGSTIHITMESGAPTGVHYTKYDAEGNATKLHVSDSSPIWFVNYIWLIILFCVTPAGVLWLCRKYPIFDKIGPVMILYVIGLILANIPMPAEIATLQGIIPTIMIPLAIPMMLFGCTFKTSEISLQARIIISGVLSVTLAVVGGYLLFGEGHPEGAKIGGMLAGKCTGGTLNAVALKESLHIDNLTYLSITIYDIIICFFYFIFLLGGGIRLFRWLYGEKTKRNISEEDAAEIKREMAAVKENPYKGLNSKRGYTQMGKILALTLLVVVVAFGLAYLVGWLAGADLANFMNEKKGGWFMAPFILAITTLGIGFSFWKPVRRLHRSYDLGMYLIYIFSLAIASMADLSNLNIKDNLNIIGFLTIAIFGSLFIHAIICRIFKVNADSMVISSVAFINSPPFVPMISNAMKNRAALVTGISSGLIGYAVGNYLGILIAKLLHLL